MFVDLLILVWQTI